MSKAKVHVYSDAVLCLGKMHRHPEARVKWERTTPIFPEFPINRELVAIDGEPFEFELRFFPRTHHCGNSAQDSYENDDSRNKT